MTMIAERMGKGDGDASGVLDGNLSLQTMQKGSPNDSLAPFSPLITLALPPGVRIGGDTPRRSGGTIDPFIFQKNKAGLQLPRATDYGEQRQEAIAKRSSTCALMPWPTPLSSLHTSAYGVRVNPPTSVGAALHPAIHPASLDALERRLSPAVYGEKVGGAARLRGTAGDRREGRGVGEAG